MAAERDSDAPEPKEDAPEPVKADKQVELVELSPSISEIPEFAKSFPEEPELRALVNAFQQGRYDVVRARAPKLAASTSDPEVARSANELRRRLNADPLAVKLLLGVLVLLVLLTSWAYLYHQH